MELYVELETLKLVAATNDRREVSSVSVKRGDALPITLRFLQSQTATRLDASTVITFALKESGKYDDDPVVLEQTFTASTVEDPDSDPNYTATPSLATSELAALFLINDDSVDDPARVTLMGEISWKATGDDGPTSIKTFSVICENDVHRGDEEILPSINGDVPGVSASAVLTFDGLASVDVTAGSLTVGDWVLNLWDGSTGSAPAEPYLSYDGGSTGWLTWVSRLEEVFNDGVETHPNFTLTGTISAHPSVTAAFSTVGNDVFLTLTADQTGTAGNSISYAFAATPSSEDDSGNLAGGVDSRFFTPADLVQTLPYTYSTGQKAQAIANLVESGSLNAGDADLETEGSGHGLILESPDASRWRITVDNSGNLSTTSL